MSEELDRRVMIEVMGLPAKCRHKDDGFDIRSHYIDCNQCGQSLSFREYLGEHDRTPLPYSTDIAAAWKVVEYLRHHHFDVEVSAKPHYEWGCRVAPLGVHTDPRVTFESGKTAPEAICKAAIAAVKKHGIIDRPDCYCRQQLPPHLRDDAPYRRCSKCGRQSYAVDKEKQGDTCGMRQPTGNRCDGQFGPLS